MSYFFSPSEICFFPAAIKGLYDAAGSWPADAVPVSDEVFSEFSKESPSGKKRGVVDGMPTWVSADNVDAVKSATSTTSQSSTTS